MSAPHKGIILHKTYPAGTKLRGKERGEWLKLTDDEAKLIKQLRAAAPTIPN